MAIGRPTNVKTMKARPRLHFLGQNTPPSPRSPLTHPPPRGRLEMPTVDGAAAAFACRSAVLQLYVFTPHGGIVEIVVASGWPSFLCHKGSRIESARRTTERPLRAFVSHSKPRTRTRPLYTSAAVQCDLHELVQVGEVNAPVEF